MPAGNVLTSVSNGTLFIVGDTQDNSIVLSQPQPGTLTITPTGTTLLNGQAGPQSGTMPPNLDILLGAGTDSLSFDLGSNPIVVPGALTVDYGTGGTGTKTTQTTGANANTLTVGGNLGIRYAAGAVTTVLDNLAVGGNLTVLHAAGDSSFTLDNRAGAGKFSSVGRSLSVTNTQGVADNTVLDTNVTGSVTFANGRARAADNAAGTTKIANANNTSLAAIGGSLSIRNASGDSATGDTVGDVLVKGNVTLALGSGAFKATVAAQHATTGPTIDGNLTVAAAVAGAAKVALGAGGTGLTVKKNLTVRSGNRLAAVALDDLRVTGTTGIFTGAGADTVSIDGAAADSGSTFGGAFSLGTGPGADALAIGSGSAAGATTTFNGSVLVSLGIGDDALKLATAGKVDFTTKVPVFDGSTGTNTKTVTTANLHGKAPTFKNFV